MSINELVICGHLTRDVEVTKTPSGTDILKFTLAVNEWRKNGDGYEEYTNFIPCVSFGSGIASYLKKGTKVTVEGSLHYSTWEGKDGKRSKLEVKARQIELPPKQKDSGLYLEDCPF